MILNPLAKIKNQNINKTEESLLSYVVTYVVPLLSIDITKLGSLLMNTGLFLLLGFIYVKRQVIYLNPLFLFIGFDIYRTEQGQILISNYKIWELKHPVFFYSTNEQFWMKLLYSL